MSQPIFLDEDVAEAIKRAAEENKTTIEAWVTDAVQRKLASWPQAVTTLAGAWPDFPMRKT